MKKYDPEIPLISLHIPKCGGQSVKYILRKWFGKNFLTHYFQTNNRMPDKYNFSNKICIHGHFNNFKGFGAKQYYPEASQFITFIRDPLEIAISNYFFWKRVARKRQLELRIIEEGGCHDYKDIDEFFIKRPQSNIFKFIPFIINENNYKDIVKNEFVYIGITKYLRDSINILSKILQFPMLEVERINASKRDEILSKDIKQKFINENRFAFKFYYHIESIFERFK